MNEAEIMNNDYFKSIAEIIKVNLKDENISLEELQNKMPELFEQAHQQYNNSLIKLFNDVFNATLFVPTSMLQSLPSFPFHNALKLQAFSA